jgi:hypothetical protein
MKPSGTISFEVDDPIFRVCRTTWERRKLINELRDIEKRLYSSEMVDIKEIIKDVSRESTYDIVLRVVGSDPAKYQNRIAAMTQALMNIPELELVLAFEPALGLIQRIFNKVTQAVKQPLILDIHYEPFLIGGAALTYAGRYGDYSVRQKIEKLIQTEFMN